MFKLADALARVENASERVALSQRILGRSGSRLINTLQGGSDALREQVEEAKRLGLAVNRIDAAKVEAANDATTRMRASVQGVINTIAVTMAPAVEGLADVTRGAISDIRELGKSTADALGLVKTDIRGVTAGFISLRGHILAALLDASRAMDQLTPTPGRSQLTQKLEAQLAAAGKALIDFMAGNGPRPAPAGDRTDDQPKLPGERGAARGRRDASPSLLSGRLVQGVTEDAIFKVQHDEAQRERKTIAEQVRRAADLLQELRNQNNGFEDFAGIL